MSFRRFWQDHPMPNYRVPVEDPTVLHPKLSARIPEELHTKLKIAAAVERTSVQAIVLEALELRLADAPKPPKPRKRIGDDYQGGPAL